MTKEEFQLLIDKYLQGKCSEEEARIIDEFMNIYRPEFDSARKNLTDLDQVELRDQLYKEIKREITEADLVSQHSRSQVFRPAAVVLSVLLVVVMLAGYFVFNTNTTDTPEEITWQVKKAEKGQKIFFSLDDGTIVHLNSESSVEYPTRFSDDRRSIILNGEAYFTVKKDPKRPFQIKTKGLITTVLGTTFNIRAYEEEDNTMVAVTSGKVSVQKIVPIRDRESDSRVILLPNQMAVYSKDLGTTEKRNFNYMEVLGWKDKIIYFKNANIYQILETLERWYGVTFIIDGVLNEDKDFSGKFENKSLKSVLDGLSFTFGFQFEMKNKVVTIK